MRAHYHIRSAFRLALAGLAAFSLAACARPTAPITTPGGVPTQIATIVPTAAPGATTVPTATPGATAAPTTAPGGQRPANGLVGPEWTIAVQGDFDGNGRPDIVAYKPSSLRTSVDPGAVDFATVVTEAVIVERRDDGTPWVRVLADRVGLRIDGALVIPFGNAGPEAMQLTLHNGRRTFLVTPLDAQGQQYTYPVGARYDAATGSYGRLGGEIPGGQPLIGPEWTMIAQGDFDRNARGDVVAFKPSTVPSRVSTEKGYLASELVIVERRADGGPAIRLFISRDGVFADGQMVGSFGTGDQRPAAVIARLFGDERKLVLTLINSAGEQYAQDVAVGYIEVNGAYAVYGPGGTLPFPLVGPEWTIAYNGSLNPAVREGVIAYKPSAVPAGNTGAGDVAVVVSELVAVDRGSNGGPAVRLAVTLDAITVDGQVIARFGSGNARPAALLARVVRGDRSIVFSPVDAGGQQFAQDARVYWDSASGLYRLAGPGGNDRPTPPPAVDPGPDWTILDISDRNADGAYDAVVYKPTGVPVVLPPGVKGVAASEVAIAQARPDGTEFPLTIANGAIYSNGYLIYTFGDGAGNLPAAYLVTINGDIVLVEPAAADGTITSLGVQLAWNADTGAYVALQR